MESNNLLFRCPPCALNWSMMKATSTNVTIKPVNSTLPVPYRNVLASMRRSCIKMTCSSHFGVSVNQSTFTKNLIEIFLIRYGTGEVENRI